MNQTTGKTKYDLEERTAIFGESAWLHSPEGLWSRNVILYAIITN